MAQHHHHEAALADACAAVEAACAAFASPDAATRGAAEAQLLAFRAAPCPLPVCQYILERSTSADALFQARMRNCTPYIQP